MEIDDNMQKNMEVGGEWKEKNQKKQIPKFILNVKKPLIKHDGKKFHTSTLEMVASSLEAHIFKKLVTKYKEHKKEILFIPEGMGYKKPEHT